MKVKVASGVTLLEGQRTGLGAFPLVCVTSVSIDQIHRRVSRQATLKVKNDCCNNPRYLAFSAKVSLKMKLSQGGNRGMLWLVTYVLYAWLLLYALRRVCDRFEFLSFTFLTSISATPSSFNWFQYLFNNLICQTFILHSIYLPRRNARYLMTVSCHPRNYGECKLFSTLAMNSTSFYQSTCNSHVCIAW